MAAHLRDRIASTLDTNADVRRQAELDLKYVISPSCLIIRVQNLTVSGRRKINPDLSMP
jgi:hypothetical protein